MKYIILFSVLISMLFSCNDDQPKESFSCGEEVSLIDDVMPIITSNCSITRCHLDGTTPLLNSKEDVLNNASSISEQVSSGAMPPTQPLSSEDVDLILCWVDDGHPDN